MPWRHTQMEDEVLILALISTLSIDAPTSTKGRPKPAFVVKNRLRTGAGSLVFLGGRSVTDPLWLPFINRSREKSLYLNNVQYREGPAMYSLKTPTPTLAIAAGERSDSPRGKRKLGSYAISREQRSNLLLPLGPTNNNLFSYTIGWCLT